MTDYLIEQIITELIKQTFNILDSLYLACYKSHAFSSSEQPKRYYFLITSDTFRHLLDNIFITFGSELYRHIVGVQLGTNCVPLVADLLSFVIRDTSN